MEIFHEMRIMSYVRGRALIPFFLSTKARAAPRKTPEASINFNKYGASPSSSRCPWKVIAM